MDLLLISVTAFFASLISLYSGFGLGTLLMPVFALFVSPELAVMATALVHGVNNVFKVALLGKHADRGVLLGFGLPAILAAFFGAWILSVLAVERVIFQYSISEKSYEAHLLPFLIGVLILFFSVFEIWPRLFNFKMARKHFILGGLLSGFFGGLSGHQGALRSAFLTKSHLSAKNFMGTNAVIGLGVDSIRLSVYFFGIFGVGRGLSLGAEIRPLVLAGVFSAWIGVWVGKRFLHKVTMALIQKVVGVLLMIVGFLLMLGWI